MFNFDHVSGDLAISQTIPPHMNKMVDFLRHKQEHVIRGSPSSDKIVVYADDQFINRKLIKVHFQQLNRKESLVDFTNGQEVVSYFQKTLTQLDAGKKKVIQPVSLVLLDINMPILNGHETLKKVKQLFEDLNNSSDPDLPLVMRPMICYLSSVERNVMEQFLTLEEQAEIYLEKPLPKNDLAALINLAI